MASRPSLLAPYEMAAVTLRRRGLEGGKILSGFLLSFFVTIFIKKKIPLICGKFPRSAHPSPCLSLDSVTHQPGQAHLGYFCFQSMLRLICPRPRPVRGKQDHREHQFSKFFTFVVGV